MASTGRGVALGGALFAVIAAWLSTGVLALATEGGPRIALLALSPVAIGFAIAAGTAVFALLRAGAPAAPLWILAFVGAPWLPVPVPDAFLVWSGPLGALLWLAVFFLLVRGACRRTAVPMGPIAWLERFVGWRPRLAAAAFSLLISGGAAVIAAPSVPSGDEPHYLIITQSLLRDGDLKIENNHARRDYQAYFAGQLRPDYLRRGRDGQIYSIHAPGISALIAPAFAVGGYRAVVIFLVALAACSGALIWHVAWLATRSAESAWFGWAAIVLGSTWIFHSFTVYPDGAGGVIALTGVWALLRADEEQRTGSTSAWPWLMHGVALAVLPWLHSRFALLAGTVAVSIVLRVATTRNPVRKAVAFLVVPAISAFCWIGYFIAIYGAPDPSAPYGGTREFSAAFIPGGLTGLVFDQRFGLIANAPVLVCAIFGFGTMLQVTRRLPATGEPLALANRRLALELLFVVVPYLLIVTNFAMWWGGWSAPARFAAAVLPVLVIPAAAGWAGFRTDAARTLAFGSLGVTAFISAALVVVDRGRLAFNTRDAYAHWLDWASPLTDLGQGVPAWFRDGEGRFFRDVAVWLLALTAAGIVFRLIARRKVVQRPGWISTIGAVLYASAAMVALTVTWTLHGVPATSGAAGQLQFLRRLSNESRVLSFAVHPPARVATETAAMMLQIESGTPYAPARGAGQNDRPLLTLPAVPAGAYRIRARTTAPGGLLTIGIGPNQFSMRTEALTMPPSPIVVEFPVDVRSLIVRGDEAARRAVRKIVVEPLGTLRAGAKVTNKTARHAVRYGNSLLYFLDDRSFPEPEGFWVEGARSSSIVVETIQAARNVTLLLRNAPVESRILVETGAWREDLILAPGEERRIQVPGDATRRTVLITLQNSAGFRPSEVEPGSRDERLLGLWVRIE